MTQETINKLHQLLNYKSNWEIFIIKEDKVMEALREFRGYLNRRLLYTFPLHWVDNIKVKDDVMIVSYFDEMQYNSETGEEPLVEIRVDEINIK